MKKEEMLKIFDENVGEARKELENDFPVAASLHLQFILMCLFERDRKIMNVLMKELETFFLLNKQRK